MITEEFIAVFQKSLELKKRQIENYENLLNYKAGANLVGKVVAEEGTKLKVLKKILSEIREEMNTRKTPS